ncbi:restriction endonuclease subunit S [Methanobrevibacter thaueri]|uniref:restriction endonuclease subunit S n=1 Tax=Methanobrevibacter thaueri TaxID=190975 RepID=UPI0038644CD7
MSLEFHEYELGDLCNISSSKRIFAREYVDAGIPFYRGKEIIELFNNRDVSTELFITTEKYESIKRKYGVPKEGDILLSSVGTLGIPYLVKNEKFYFKDGNLTWFKDFDSKLNNKYLYWWLQSIEAKYQINNKCIGSTQKALPIKTLEKFEINLPSLTAQLQIVDILENISNKIKVNISINKNYFLSLYQTVTLYGTYPVTGFMEMPPYFTFLEVLVMTLPVFLFLK